MVGGSDAHASVYSNTVHLTPPGANIQFDLSQYAVNIDYTNGNDFLVVRRNGLYSFTWTATFNEPSILGLFVNTVLDPTTVIANNSGATVTIGSQLLRLLTGDRIELRNLGLTQEDLSALLSCDVRWTPFGLSISTLRFIVFMARKKSQLLFREIVNFYRYLKISRNHPKGTRC
jgi:hypothetical protein